MLGQFEQMVILNYLYSPNHDQEKSDHLRHNILLPRSRPNGALESYPEP